SPSGAPPPPRPAAASHPTTYPYGLFHTGDGKPLLLGLQNEREWAAFCAIVLEMPELAHDPRFAGNARRNAAREDLRRIIDGVFAQLTAAEVSARLERANIANARANDMHEVWAHPQLAARERWRTVQTPHGRIAALLPAGSWGHR